MDGEGVYEVLDGVLGRMEWAVEDVSVGLMTKEGLLYIFAWSKVYKT